MNTGPFISGGHGEHGTSEDAIASPSAPCAPSLLEIQMHSSSQSECFEEASPSMATNGNGSPLSFSVPSDNSFFEAPSSDIVVDLKMDHNSSPDTTVLHHSPLPACADIRKGGNNKTERTTINEDPSRDDVIIANAVPVNDIMVDAQMINEQAHTPIHQGQAWWQKKYLFITGIIFIVAAFAIAATLLALYLKTKSNPVPDEITPLPSTPTPAYLTTPSAQAYLSTPSAQAYLTTPSTPAYLLVSSTPEYLLGSSTPAYLLGSSTPAAVSSTPACHATFQTIKVGTWRLVFFEIALNFIFF